MAPAAAARAGHMSAAALPTVDEELAALLERSDFKLNFVVSCARLKDCPIVYASDGFYELTGASAVARTL